nr:hypothetical protein [Tanacetum cinerariifolium]
MDDPNITMKEYIRLEEEKAHRRGKVYNWETATYGKIWYDKDVHDLRSIETKFPYIVFNDTLTSDEALSYEPTISQLNTLCPQHIDKFISKDETSLSECDEEEQNVLYFNDLFPSNVINSDDSKSNKDNDDDKIDIKHSSRGLSIEPLPNVIKIDAQWSNKLFETSHDTSSNFSKTKLLSKD